MRFEGIFASVDLDGDHSLLVAHQAAEEICLAEGFQVQVIRPGKVLIVLLVQLRAAACAQPAEADIGPKETDYRFDPLRTLETAN